MMADAVLPGWRTLPSPTYSDQNLMESDQTPSDSNRTFLAEGSARFLVLSDIFPTVFTQIQMNHIGIHWNPTLDSNGTESVGLCWTPIGLM